MHKPGSGFRATPLPPPYRSEVESSPTPHSGTFPQPDSFGVTSFMVGGHGHGEFRKYDGFLYNS